MGEEREMLRWEMDERKQEREREKRVTEDKMIEEDLKEGK